MHPRGDCVRVREMQGMGILNFAYRGKEGAGHACKFDRKWADQMRELRSVRRRVPHWCDHGEEPDRRGVAPIHDPKRARGRPDLAPAVRVAVGEAFGIPAGENVLDKIVTALKLMGVDEVYDTTFGADFTTIAESEEISGAAEKRRPVPDVHLLLPAWGEVSENENPKSSRTSPPASRRWRW